MVTQACHGLVECIEQGRLNETSTRDLLNHYLQPLLKARADTIVLGCTHYPFVKPLILELVGEDIALIDTGAAVARHLQRRLQQAGLLSTTTQPGNARFQTNSRAQNAKRIISQLWGIDTEVMILD